MKRLKKALSIFIIILFIINIKNSVFAKEAIVKPDNVGPQNTTLPLNWDTFDKLDQYYCIDLGSGWSGNCVLDLAKNDKNQYVMWEYKSDDKEAFDRAIAYVLRGIDHNGIEYQTGFANRSYGEGYVNGKYCVGTMSRQQALWGIEYEFWKKGGYNNTLLTGPFKNSKIHEGAVYNDLLFDAWGNNGSGPASVEFSGENKAKIKTGDLLMDGSNGTLEIKELVGKVIGVDVTWNDNETKTYNENVSGSASIQFRNSNNTKDLNVGDFNKGKVVIQNKRQVGIKSIKINVKVKASGWRVRIYKWNNHDAGSQDLINTELFYGKESQDDSTVPAKYLNGELTVKKLDFDNDTKLNNAEFKIYARGNSVPKEGWLGYSNGKVTYGLTNENAYIFKTGVSYCGNDKKTGEFKLSDLKFGNYYVFEVNPANDNYEKLTEFGWTTNAGSSLLPSNNGMRILLGGQWYKAFKESDYWKALRTKKDGQKELLEVSTENGKYNFNNWEHQCIQINSNNTKFNFTVRNKKTDGKLTVKKVDYDNKTILNGFKFAIFRRCGENNSGWLGYSNGKVTYNNSWSNAAKFETGKNYCGNKLVSGEFTLSGLRYGQYFVFEVGTNGDSEYVFEKQLGYSTSAGNFLFTKEDLKMKNSDGTDVGRILCGADLYERNYVDVTMQSGDKYQFIPKSGDKSGWYHYITLADCEGPYQLTDKGTIYNSTKHATFTVKNRKNTELKIVKKDQDTGKAIAGVGFKVCVKLQESNYRQIDKKTDDSVTYKTLSVNKWYWLKSDGSLTSNVNEAFQFTTGEDGTKTISRIPYGQYLIFETQAAKGYRLEEQPGVNEGKPEDYTGNFLNKPYLKLNTTNNSIGKESRLFTVEAKNTPESTKLIIDKIDGTYQVDTGDNKKIHLAGAEFKIYGTDSKGQNQAGWIKQTKDGDAVKTEYTNYTNATTFTTDNNGIVSINNLREGTYYIFETKAPTSPISYDITAQKGYKQEYDENQKIPGVSDIKVEKDWVYLGKAITKINEKTKNETSIELTNINYVTIKGKVWLDKTEEDKVSKEYDYVYTEQHDELLNGIQVNLYSNKDNKEPIAKATTQNIDGVNGRYEFKYKLDGKTQLTYWEVANCYVEFEYDNKTYIVVDPFVGNDNKINSKAIEETMTQNELKDENLTGDKGDLPGRAITYKNKDILTGNQILDNSSLQNKDLKSMPLIGFYNNATYSIEDINLGIIKKIDPSMQVAENLQYVKIAMNGYTYTYKYGDPAVTTSQFAPTVSRQNEISYSPTKLYPSDVAYNTINPDGLKVYLVYSIDVRNNMTDSIDDVYNEGKLYIKDLKVEYDSNRFTLSNEQIGTDDENKQFNMWTSANGVAKYNKGSENDVYKNGLNSEETKTSYIQLRMNNDFVNKILQGNKEELDALQGPGKWATWAGATGYHEYLRTDNVWVDDASVNAFDGAQGQYNDKNKYKSNEKYYVHKSVECEDDSASLSIKFELGDTRTISGTVFKDNTLDSRQNEKIGNGYKDENEKTVKDVIVNLITENDSIAKLYGKDDKGVITSKDAVIKVDDSGKYELPGVVPGKYYLKFTYGSGETVYTDIDGNKIEKDINNKDITNVKSQCEGKDIETSLYKSTILTGAAKNANDEKWYLAGIEEGVYSIAVDEESIIEDRMKESNNNIELNYAYMQSISNKPITAVSPKMDINFEFTSGLDVNYNETNNLKSECSGMNFGIIERPEVKIELVKKIKNVKLTLQNGTSVINGDPSDKNISPYISKINDGNVKMELDPSYLYGSNCDCTYTISALNISDLDYATKEYYKYGDKNPGDKPIATTVKTIVDYINNSHASYEVVTDKKTNLTEQQIKDYFAEEVINSNKNYTQAVFSPEEELYPKSAGIGNSSTQEYEFTVNNLLSTSDEILGWESYSEIIGISNRTLTPQSVCHTGSYIMGDISTLEADTASATVSIYSSTGENRNMFNYYLVGGTLLMTALGLLIIIRITRKNNTK